MEFHFYLARSMDICEAFTPVQDDSHVCNNCGHAKMKHNPPYKVEKSVTDILTEIAAGMTDKDWEDWDKSAKIARENRVRCNKLTKEEREKYMASGMRMIYGHKWTSKKPTEPGWYWIKNGINEYVAEIFRDRKGLYVYYEDSSDKLKDFDKRILYAGPLEKPS